jgi:hypothetical protein
METKKVHRTRKKFYANISNGKVSVPKLESYIKCASSMEDVKNKYIKYWIAVMHEQGHIHLKHPNRDKSYNKNIIKANEVLVEETFAWKYALQCFKKEFIVDNMEIISKEIKRCLESYHYYMKVSKSNLIEVDKLMEFLL